MKKFSVPCDFDGVKSPFTIYVGSARADHHPLHFQADWLSKERGGTIPQEVMESLSKLQDLARKNNVKFEDLCVYALGAAQDSNDENVVAEPEQNTEEDSEAAVLSQEEPDEDSSGDPETEITETPTETQEEQDEEKTSDANKELEDTEEDALIDEELKETEKSLEEELEELEKESEERKKKK